MCEPQHMWYLYIYIMYIPILLFHDWNDQLFTMPRSHNPVMYKPSWMYVIWSSIDVVFLIFLYIQHTYSTWCVCNRSHPMTHLPGPSQSVATQDASSEILRWCSSCVNAWAALLFRSSRFPPKENHLVSQGFSPVWLCLWLCVHKQNLFHLCGPVP